MNDTTNQFPQKQADWTHFYRYFRADEIAEEINHIPFNWNLTPVKAKSAYRKNWDSEKPIPRNEIQKLLQFGGVAVSKKTQKPYQFYASGYAIRTGNGLIAIDVDGESALPLLEKMSQGDLPKTISWTSGKEGRFQLLFEIPKQFIETLKGFTRKIFKKWQGVKTKKGDLLEFRYHKSQSVLPPSFHPDTGSYYWINSPQNNKIAIAPDWLCSILAAIANDIKKDVTNKSILKQRKTERLLKRKDRFQADRSDLVEYLNSAVNILGLNAFSWTGHNFHDCGDHLEGCCPNHKSHSGRSFHVDKESLSWYCFGCQEGGGVAQYRSFVEKGKTHIRGKEFYKIVKQLAQEAFIQWFEPKTAKKNREQEDLGLNLYSTVNSSIKSLAKYSNSARTDQNKVTFIPNLNSDYTSIQDNNLVLVYKQGQRAQVWQEASAKYILDRSGTGAGKSHSAGNYQNQKGKTWFISSDHRNPSTLTVEQNYVDLPTRNIGLVKDPDRDTPLGNPFLVNAALDQIPDVSGNCHYAAYFNQARQKNYQINSADGSRNAICNACCYRNKCTVAQGTGFGYRQERSEALKANKIRCHINSLPLWDSYDFSNDVAIIDEADLQIQATRKITVSFEQFKNSLLAIADRDRELFCYLWEYFKKFRQHWEGTLVGNGKHKHGVNLPQIKDLLGHKLIKDILSKLADFILSLSQVIVTSDFVASDDKDRYWQVKAVNQQFRQEAASLTAENFKKLTPNFLIEFLEIINGSRPGSIRINSKNQLIVTVLDLTHAESLSKFSKVILLDATANPQYLADKLNTDRLLVVEQQKTALDNLEIVKVDLQGVSSNDWSQTAQERQRDLFKALQKRHPQIELISLKKYSDRNGYWFKDSRATNRYQGVKAIAAFGKPQINLGVAQDFYQTLYGHNQNFAAYYQSLIEKEILQLIGRQRANLYPESQFKLYLCSNIEIEFLQRAGFSHVKHIPALFLCPEAATKQQFRRYQLTIAIGDLIKSNQEITQNKIAKLIAVSQSWISKLVKSVSGGWRSLIIFLSLYINPNRSGNIWDCPYIATWLLTGSTAPIKHTVHIKQAVNRGNRIKLDQGQNQMKSKRRIEKFAQENITKIFDSQINQVRTINTQERIELVKRIYNSNLINSLRLLIQYSVTPLTSQALSIILNAPVHHVKHELIRLAKTKFIAKDERDCWHYVHSQKNKILQQKIKEANSLFVNYSGLDALLLNKYFQGRDLKQLNIEEIDTLMALGTQRIHSLKKEEKQLRKNQISFARQTTTS